MPLAGELQPEAFFLPFNLLLRLPEGILWQQISMQIIAGLATYALLRELGLSRLAAWMGGALFSLNGTMAWTPGPAAAYCALPFLPLLLFGMERARKQQEGAASILIIGLSTAWSILAGFPETAYIGALPVLAWGLYRLACTPERWLMARRSIAGFVLGMLVASPLLIAFVDYVRQSDSFGIHNVGETSLPWAAFSATLMPYVYGALGTSLHSLVLSQIWVAIGGYTSILVILMAVVGVTSKSAHRGLKFILLIWILLAWSKTFGVRPVVGLMNHIPLMKQTNFFRCAPPSWELALVILAAFGLDDFLSRTPGGRKPFGIAMVLLATGVVLAWPQRDFWERPQALIPFGFLLLGLSLVWVLLGLLTAGLSWKYLPAGQCRIALASLLVLDAAIMFMVPQSASVHGDQLDTAAVQFLADHLGLYRFYTLGPIQPNYGAYFRVASINHNVEPVPKLWADYVERNLLPGFSKIDLSETFWPGTMPAGEGERALSQNLANYLNLGVRYIVTKPGQSPTPITFVPTKSEERSNTARSQPPVVAFERFRLLSNDPAKPAIERFIAKVMLKMGHFMLRSTGPQDIGKGSEAIGTPDTEYIVLQNDQSVRTNLMAPPSVPADSPVTAVGTMIGDSGAAADGELTVEICAGSACQSGQRSLAGSASNQLFRIPLDEPLAAPEGSQLRLTFAHQHGTRPVTLWLGAATQAQQIDGPNGPLPHHTLQLAFEYGMALPGLRKAYTDPVMDVWELPNPAPYFQVIRGGPCTFLTMHREDVTVECASAATLLRRELYMPGWRETVNGTAAADVQQNDIFQSSALPIGRSQVRYHFAPPYVEFGWSASGVGIAGLLWQVVLLGRLRQQRPPKMASSQERQPVS